MADKETHVEFVEVGENMLTGEELRELKKLLQLWRFGRWFVYVVLGAGTLAIGAVQAWDLIAKRFH